MTEKTYHTPGYDRVMKNLAASRAAKAGAGKTWGNTTPAELLAEERAETNDAILALVIERDRLRAEMAARDVAAAENCNAATAMRHERDRYRAALEKIAATGAPRDVVEARAALNPRD